MGHLDSNAPEKSIHPGTKSRIQECIHYMRQIAGGIKGRYTEISVDHQLLVSRSHRCIDAFPCFDTTAQPERLGYLWREIPISADDNTHPLREKRQDKVQCRDDGRCVVVAMLHLTS